MTLLDDTVSAAAGRELTRAKLTAARMTLRIRRGSLALRLIGKNGSVKLWSKPATWMTETYDLIDAVPMRQRERSHR